jgi:hypothetical protein
MSDASGKTASWFPASGRSVKTSQMTKRTGATVADGLRPPHGLATGR